VRIRLKEADEQMIRELERNSAFTWEGMTLDEDNLHEVAHIFEDEKLVKNDTEEICGYFWYGNVMNRLYNLHGDNRYSDDLPFLSFERNCFDGSGNLFVFKMEIGARWLDDIVRNNAEKEADRQR